MLTALPQSHSSGISYLSLAMMLGLPTLMIDEASGAAVAAAMNEFRPTAVIGFPMSLADLPIDALGAHAKDTVHTIVQHHWWLSPAGHTGRGRGSKLSMLQGPRCVPVQLLGQGGQQPRAVCGTGRGSGEGG